jgi:hypothetical protein
MNRITISKTEYRRLKKESKAYRSIATYLFELMITKSTKK